MSVLNQGEDTEDWAYDEAVIMEVNSMAMEINSFNSMNPLPQETTQEVNSSVAQEVRKDLMK